MMFNGSPAMRSQTGKYPNFVSAAFPALPHGSADSFVLVHGWIKTVVRPTR